MLQVDRGKRYVSVLCVCWVGHWLVVISLIYRRGINLRAEEMLLAYYLAAFSLFSGMWGSILCLLRTFCWLILWGSGNLGSRCEFRQAFNDCSLGRVGGWSRQ